jgi:hypothetical protein
MKSMLRRVAFALLTLLLLYGVGEGIGFLGCRFAAGEWPSRTGLRDERRAISNSRTGAIGAAIVKAELEQRQPGPIAPWQVIHPYLGYVFSPSPNSESVNLHGFLGAPPPFEPLAEDSARFIVGIFGGSVAQLMVETATRTLLQELALSECLAGRSIEVVNFALPGVKQPQQLLTLNYFLTLGMHLDLVITLDGFNEIVLPAAENEKQGVFPFYPRSWREQVAGIKDVQLMRRVGAIEFWQDLRRGAARTVDQSLLQYSYLANFIWLLSDRIIDRNINLRQVDLAVEQGKQKTRGGGYLARGPKREYATDDDRYRDFAAVWSRSTALMSKLAGSLGIPSYHFLQPNQRVPGSKPFTPAERETALRKGHSYDRPARLGYPYLIWAGAALAADRIEYHDLTMVFEDVEEPLYIDDCCHVSEEGSRLLAEEIAGVIRDSMDEACAPGIGR